MEHPGSFLSYVWRNSFWTYYVIVGAAIGMVVCAMAMPQPYAAFFCFAFGLCLGSGLMTFYGWYPLYKRRVAMSEEDDR